MSNIVIHFIYSKLLISLVFVLASYVSSVTLSISVASEDMETKKNYNAALYAFAREQQINIRKAIINK